MKVQPNGTIFVQGKVDHNVYIQVVEDASLIDAWSLTVIKKGEGKPPAPKSEEEKPIEKPVAYTYKDGMLELSDSDEVEV